MLVTPVSKFDEAVPLDSVTRFGVLGVKGEFDEPLAEPPEPLLPPPVPPSSPRQQLPSACSAALAVGAVFRALPGLGLLCSRIPSLVSQSGPISLLA